MGGKGSGRTPREYPAEIVNLVCGMYRDGMTVAEIRKAAPKGYRVQTILERYLPERRPAVKRDQRGAANDTWRGSDAGYKAVHLRLGRAADHECVDCGAPAAEWSSIHGCPAERRERSPYCHHPNHYAPRCRKCHRAYDRKEGDRHA